MSEFALDPATPTQGKPVAVRLGVYNKGNAPAGAFKVKWFPGENYPAPACEWTVGQPGPRGGRILNCTYAGYPSWYAKINTKVIVDADGAIAESDEGNNIFTKEISVSQPVAATAADLYVSEFALNPATPIQGRSVAVRVGVYNKGNAPAGAFKVKWFPGENYPTPACEWTVDSLAARGGRILNCTYAGYPSWYAMINTKVTGGCRSCSGRKRRGEQHLHEGDQRQPALSYASSRRFEVGRRWRARPRNVCGYRPNTFLNAAHCASLI